MDKYRFAGHRVIQFPDEALTALNELGLRLMPYKDEIIERWISQQFSTWEPPGMKREDVRVMFSDLLNGMLSCLVEKTPEQFVANLDEVGAELARSNFPYEALVISLHFLEESYMPFLLNPPSPDTQEWLICMDQFLHVVIAAIATAYFSFHRNQLLAEAEVGRLVQEGLSPQIPKRIGDLEIGFVYVSSSEHARLGGDFLDVFKLDEDRTAFLIGDLSGHGLPAVADSVLIRSIFKGFISENPDLTETMARVNKVLSNELAGDHFATALAGTYESSGRLTLVNAGDPPPIVANRTLSHVEDTGGVPLAVLDDSTYKSSKVVLRPGDCFVAYTDGLIEARVEGEMDMFGERRVRDIIEAMRDAGARDIAEHLLDQARRHANGHLHDDTAILVLKRV